MRTHFCAKLFTLSAVLTPRLCAGQTGIVDRSVMGPYDAQVTVAEGQVSRLRDDRPWAVSKGERISVAQVIITGKDGYAHFTTAGGNHFDVFSNSRVIFRENLANTGDLIDVVAGRVRVHLQPSAAQPRERVFCPTAVIATHQPATVGIAIDEDNRVRIDVLEGGVTVQHSRLPSSEPVAVRAVDAILVQPNEPISRRVDRGSLYRYTARIWAAITFSHSAHSGEPIEGKQLVPHCSQMAF